MALRCDMQKDCEGTVTHVDEKGYVYCAVHGPERRQSGIRCRQLTIGEIAKLDRGEPIPYYRRTVSP